METITDATETAADQAAEAGKIRLFLGQFNWRMMLVRVLVNALTLLIISLLLPDIYFANVERRLLNVLLVAAVLGILNAFVKPIVQFLTLPFIFATYGFVVVAINTVMLLLLAAILDRRFVVESLTWAIIGGALMGLISSVLESLFGLNLPIVPKGRGADDRGIRPASRPNPVESLLFEGLAGQGETGLAAEDEIGSTIAAETESDIALTRPRPETSLPPAAADNDENMMQPGAPQ